MNTVGGGIDKSSSGEGRSAFSKMKRGNYRAAATVWRVGTVK
jgi:hypothetical protein